MNSFHLSASNHIMSAEQRELLSEMRRELNSPLIKGDIFFDDSEQKDFRVAHIGLTVVAGEALDGSTRILRSKNQFYKINK